VLFGAHTSIAGGLHNAFMWGEKFGCECIQVFTKSQLQWRGRPIEPEDIDKWFAAWERNDFMPCYVHDSYLINLASPDIELRKKSIDGFVDECERAALLAIPWVNTHPGSHKGSGVENGLKLCADSLKKCLDRIDGLGVGILLETTAGQGGDLGAKFEHLAYLIDACGGDERLGVCVDTCHIFCARYDLKTKDAYEKTWAEFDRIIGLDRLLAFHLNDSKFACNTNRDRHAAIGKGEIGIEGFRMLAKDPRFADIPGATELEDDDTMYSVALLKKLRDS
jgi:deoxyribonuclease-4